MSAMMITKEKKKRKEVGKNVAKVWGVVVLAFIFILNLQGVMAEVGPTNDTYFTGVSKALNHLSLGIIDIRGEEKEKVGGEDLIVPSGEAITVSDILLEEKEEAAFDGYVAESTDTRVRLTNSAMQIWSQDFKTAMFGVGLGGAGTALYNNALSPASKEIVQNQYASLLLETGLIGILLFVFTLVMIVRLAMKKKQAPIILTLMVMYGVSLLFFSGLPNALHIYLMPVLILFL